MTTKIGLVGYGTGGRYFHAPYINASQHCELVGVVARSAASKQAVWEDNANMTAVDSLAELLEIGVDAVVISTPPETRSSLVLEAIEAGVAVVADKPFAADAAEAEKLVAAAAEKGVLLNVFHNRRQDADVVTAQAVLSSEALGHVHGLDLRLDIDAPDTLELGSEGGLLRDLGSHVVDQALVLMGPAIKVTARLGSISTPEGETNARFHMVIEHESQAVSRISASKCDHLISREMRIFGDRGSYVSNFADVQVIDVFNGVLPRKNPDTWGLESPENWGVLRTDAGEEQVQCQCGDYTRFYDSFGQAVEENGQGPVPGWQAVEVLKVLDAVVDSDREERTITIR